MRRTIYILYVLALLGVLSSCGEEPKHDPSQPNDISALMEKIASTAAMPVANDTTIFGIQFGISKDRYTSYMDSLVAARTIHKDSSSRYTFTLHEHHQDTGPIRCFIYALFNESDKYHGELYQLKLVTDNYDSLYLKNTSVTRMLTNFVNSRFGKIFFEDRVFGNDRRYWFKGTQSVEVFGSAGSGQIEFTDMVREHQQLQWEAAKYKP